MRSRGRRFPNDDAHGAGFTPFEGMQARERGVALGPRLR